MRYRKEFFKFNGMSNQPVSNFKRFSTNFLQKTPSSVSITIVSGKSKQVALKRVKS